MVQTQGGNGPHTGGAGDQHHLIELRQVRKVFRTAAGDFTALKDVDLQIGPGEFVAEIGPIAGEQVAAGAVVVRLADLSAWQIETDDLTELNVVRVKEGARATLTFDALPGVHLTGKVVRIKPIGEKKQGEMTYTVVIQPDNHEERLRWNMTATATIE